jgi:chromosome partitioning protein
LFLASGCDALNTPESGAIAMATEARHKRAFMACAQNATKQQSNFCCFVACNIQLCHDVGNFNERAELMRTIVLASQKGGAGKTTLAAHLATHAEAVGDGPVVLIDTDPQATLAEWWNAREADTPAFAEVSLKTLPDKLKQLAEAGFKLAIIDTPPAMTAALHSVVAVADLVVVPVKPSPNDLRAVGSTVALLEEAGKPFLFAVNEAKKAATITLQAVAALSEHGRVAPSVVGDRVGFPQAMINGLTMAEIEARNRGAEEIGALWENIKATMQQRNNATNVATVKKAGKVAI